MGDIRENTDEVHQNVLISPGKCSPDRLIDIYDDWADQYDKNVAEWSYNGPSVTAEALASVLGTNKNPKILDIGAGTGLVAEQLQQRGFSNLDALDPCQAMLDKAKENNLYGRLICDFVGENRLDIDSDTYDGLVSCGTFIPNHADHRAFEELIRITKPGGYIVIVLKEFYLTQEPFVSHWEPSIRDWEAEGKWKLVSKNTAQKYYKDDICVTHTFQVL